ncbi:hypothetical protein F5B20DRAFT_52053 [Whalleya microplaca]|nr:hypothetical protein F5B20DRAFT_52053 [Whalleya microplaca]
MSHSNVNSIVSRRIKYFEKNSHKFQYEGSLSPGGHGDVYLIREISPGGTLTRRFIAKFSVNNPRSLASLHQEVKIAKKLYGALHISQPLIINGAMAVLDSVPSTAPPEDKVVLISTYYRLPCP